MHVRNKENNHTQTNFGLLGGTDETNYNSDPTNHQRYKGWEISLKTIDYAVVSIS